MADNDTSTAQTGTQDPDASDEDATATASTAGGDEVSVLKSRFAGATAKVNTLAEEKKALLAEKAALQKQLADAQSGITTADEAAKALIAAKDEEIAQLLRANKVTALQARFPEVYAELGEDAVSLSEDKLAAMEARFQGAAAAAAEGDEPPTPRGNNAARRDSVPKGGREPAGESSADILAQMQAMGVPPEWGGQS